MYANHNDASLSIADFCKLEGISKTTYFSLRKRGLGPDELRIPGTNIGRITAGSRIKWQQSMMDLADSPEVTSDNARRSKLASKAVDAAFKKGTHRRMPKTPRKPTKN